jgi:dTDP-glucose 4,6-dehydratase
LQPSFGFPGQDEKARCSMNPLAADLDHVLAHTTGLWEELRGRRIFITGGTGFFGCWLLESFAWANDKLDLNASALVLTRNVESFRKKAPHLASHPAIQFLPGDVRSFDFPAGQFSHIIHAATEASAKLNVEDPQEMLDTIIGGTSQVLDFAGRCGVRKLLLTSSGAVYGKQPPELTHIPEDHPGAPDPLLPGSAYGEGKRVSEHLCAVHSLHHGYEAKIARCFAFVGPQLPLDTHFAIGNFIRDGMAGGPIRVKGDGTPFRSYLYAADLAIWLWTILFRAPPGRAFNVGSEAALDIRRTAEAVAAQFQPPVPVQVARASEPGKPAERYVPSTRRSQLELGLNERVAFDEGVRRTIRWHQGIDRPSSSTPCSPAHE